MHRHEAKALARKVTAAQLSAMLEKARITLTREQWQQRSKINPSFTRGAIFNIFIGCKFGEGRARIEEIMATNMIREFGEFLPDGLAVMNRTRHDPNSLPAPHHEDPKPFPARPDPAERKNDGEISGKE